jgi:hypothetical protein
MKSPMLDDETRRFVDLLRSPNGAEAAMLDELHSLSLKLLIDSNVLISLAQRYIPEDHAIQFANQLLHARSEAARGAAADRRAAEVRRVIDDIRRREGEVPNSVLAAQLNKLGIAAPRGGEWSGAQVYRVLKRTSQARS